MSLKYTLRYAGLRIKRLNMKGLLTRNSFQTWLCKFAEFSRRCTLL